MFSSARYRIGTLPLYLSLPTLHWPGPPKKHLLLENATLAIATMLSNLAARHMDAESQTDRQPPG